MIEVCVFTALLGLGMMALNGFQIHNGDIDAPGSPGVRDYMLRYMANLFVGNAFGPAVGQITGWVVSVVFGGLLLSAVNTAIVDLIAISFLMSRDRELPRDFELTIRQMPTISPREGLPVIVRRRASAAGARGLAVPPTAVGA